MATIPYDVSNVVPMGGRDPAIQGMRSKPRKRRLKRVDLPSELERFRLYTVDDLDQFAMVDWLIDGWLADGELTGLYGQGGSYKSFLALAWAALIAQGGKPVIYIVAEGMSGMRARLAAWSSQHEDADLSCLYLMPANVAMHRNDQVGAWIDAMKHQLGKRQPALVVVDTLARNFVGGSENDPREMGQFVDGLERIRKEFGSAVLVIHHTTKEGKTERGTESLRNASFAMLKIDKSDSRGAQLVCDRMKDAEPPNPVGVPLAHVRCRASATACPASPSDGPPHRPRRRVAANRRIRIGRLIWRYCA